MNINEIRRVLEQLEELYAAAGAAGAAKDLKSVVRMLDGHNDKSIEEFVTETKALLSGATEQKTSAEPKLDVVSSHSERLLSAGEDLVRFDASLAAIDSDSRVGKPEWLAIANNYLNIPTGGNHIFKFKTAKEARAAIRDAFIERYEAGSKQGIIKKLTRWAS